MLFTFCYNLYVSLFVNRGALTRSKQIAPVSIGEQSRGTSGYASVLYHGGDGKFADRRLALCGARTDCTRYALRGARVRRPATTPREWSVAPSLRDLVPSVVISSLFVAGLPATNALDDGRL